MSSRIAIAGTLAVALAGLSLCWHAAADEPKATKGQSVSELALEVNALRALHHLKAKPEQLKALQKLAAETAQKPRQRTGKASKDYIEMLTDLRAALIDGSDEDRIDELEEKIDELHETEKPDLDDDVEVTAAARKHAVAVLSRFKPSQVANYIGQLAEEMTDPVEVITDGFEVVRKLKGDEWKSRRDEIAEEVGYLVAGLDTDKASSIREQVIVLLTSARDLKEEELKARQRELEKKAKQIVGEVAPTEVIVRRVEHGMAELLSNPRLAAVLEARIK